MTAPAQPSLDAHERSSALHEDAAQLLLALTGASATAAAVSVDNLAQAYAAADRGEQPHRIDRLVLTCGPMLALVEVDEPLRPAQLGLVRVVLSTCACGAGLVTPVSCAADLAAAEKARAAALSNPRGLAGTSNALPLEHVGPCPLGL